MVTGAGSYLSSGISYLGVWKASPEKKSLADQDISSSGWSYYNPPAGAYSGSEDIIRNNG